MNEGFLPTRMRGVVKDRGDNSASAAFRAALVRITRVVHGRDFDGPDGASVRAFTLQGSFAWKEISFSVERVKKHEIHPGIEAVTVIGSVAAHQGCTSIR